MKNWSPENTKEIRSWLDIGTYRKFEDISLIEFYHELWARNLFFKEYREDFESKTLMDYFSKIFSGNPFLIEEGQLGYMFPANKLFHPPHFFLTTLERLAETSIIAMQRGGFVWHEGDNYSINRDLREESLSDIMPDQFSRTVMFEIDLASGTDEEIAESLKAALPQWRKVKGIDENPLESVRFGYGTIKKLISYRVIPMLDILVWAAIKKIRVSDDRLSRLLYTDDDEESDMRLSSQIKDTDRPLALKACTIDFIRQFHFFMNKNSHLKEMKVSDVMKISD
ncbi:hypothetical protein KKZ74_17035 [Enterobacter hormaechei subsp. xiangfangensis]|uniref:DUF6387 family protein n=1 Tax=Klebsiella pneumoniae TaxID=573 RepID=UPI0009B9BAC3|nr:DUF6387 family protein [Klebsiella pneumoniae]EBE6910835.1 hypothetical protein [Salmonella enterica]MBT1796379.1 hypothetical protein [Enterobacter hormaechei subsp. xiangfangensis]HCT5370124.1 hypothetical protein [Citrobacter koseri]SLP10350.1 Uncharacterised protein [Klebsiella pneumoniae]HBS7955913.1 hypothetical protein [Klebsiella pneumoniae]